MKYQIIALGLLLAGSATAQITSFSSKDSLKAQNPLKCVPVEAIRADSSAADVAAGALKCLKKKSYGEAAELTMVASAFANFDTRRVSDKSAHIAQQALFSETFRKQSEERMTELFAHMNQLGPESERHKAICAYLESLGPPSYFPKYMIAHGMATFTGSKEPPLIEPFDAQTSWAATLSEFVNCANAS